MASYKVLLEKRRQEYKKYEPVFCPCLREYIQFNSDGFNHLRFRTDGTPRKSDEQMYKLGLLPLVIPAIKLADAVEKYERRFGPIGRKKKDGQTIKKSLEFWALVTVVGKQNVKIKVILRRIGTGNIHFWSVMKLGENIKTPT